MKNCLCVNILVLRALAHCFRTSPFFRLSSDCTIVHADITNTIMNISSSNEEVLEPTTQSEIESGPIAAEISTKKRRRRHAITSEWKMIAMRLEAALRPFALRYGKLDADQIAHIARTAIKENVDDEDIYFRKGLTKAQSNVSTWKHRSLTCMEVCSLLLAFILDF